MEILLCNNAGKKVKYAKGYIQIRVGGIEHETCFMLVLKRDHEDTYVVYVAYWCCISLQEELNTLKMSFLR